ncbi:MAG TPA: SGNH/GDSL hydrolase family protein [Flavisolibacter sp.]|jgi:lysophospholipase L1-like esterase|nr:SGNH/GDSL hydrolase family protein [Flavisolibacter sp.]
MRIILFAFLLVPVSLFSQKIDSMHSYYTYLALGDSYTIGEGVQLNKNFPYQAVCQLREKGLSVTAPEIIAKTGWTTDELEDGIKRCKLLPKYDFVSLLIGVNNQYRGGDVMIYKMEFEELLKKAIRFANDKASHVIVISIPDYSVTPFVKKEEAEKVAREIDVFNNINKAVSIQYKVQYMDITSLSREAGHNPSLTIQDHLHPSATAYEKWASKLTEIMLNLLK